MSTNYLLIIKTLFHHTLSTNGTISSIFPLSLLKSGSIACFIQVRSRISIGCLHLLFKQHKSELVTIFQSYWTVCIIPFGIKITNFWWLLANTIIFKIFHSHFLSNFKQPAVPLAKPSLMFVRGRFWEYFLFIISP